MVSPKIEAVVINFIQRGFQSTSRVLHSRLTGNPTINDGANPFFFQCWYSYCTEEEQGASQRQEGASFICSVTKSSCPGELHHSTHWIRQKPQKRGTWLCLLFRDPGQLMLAHSINWERTGLWEEWEGEKKEKNCKLVILGHPIKPRHLCNAARFTFRTEFRRFRKAAYKHHSMPQTILNAFWPEPMSLKASFFFFFLPSPPLPHTSLPQGSDTTDISLQIKSTPSWMKRVRRMRALHFIKGH